MVLTTESKEKEGVLSVCSISSFLNFLTRKLPFGIKLQRAIGPCLNSSCIVCSLSCVEFFHFVLTDILYLTETAMLPFIMKLTFFICLSFDIFHLAVFCHINICIVKQMYINFSVCSLHTCEIDSRYEECGCIGMHSSVNIISLFHLFFSLTTYDSTESCIVGW